MELLFDSTAVEILSLMGYKYFCNREITVPEPDPNEGMCAYWEMIPFKTKASALKMYLSLKKSNSNIGVWWEDEHLEELSGGLFGLIVYLNLTNDLTP